MELRRQCLNLDLLPLREEKTLILIRCFHLWLSILQFGLLAFVAFHELPLEQMNVKTTFLYGQLEEQIYMRQPEGYVESGTEDKMFLVKKSLYRLKQSPH